jgi:hypothetical protein
VQLGFKQTETRDTFRERLHTFRDGAIVEPQVSQPQLWRAALLSFILLCCRLDISHLKFGGKVKLHSAWIIV